MREVFIRLLENALEDFYAQEQRNLQLNVHEICHGHRLAIYFENRIREYDDTHRERLFDNYFVDIEFNRTEGGAVKRVCYDDELHDTRCDMLLHSKGNVLPPEREDQDIKEISRMVRPAEEGAPDAAICNTLFGVYLKIGQTCYFGTKYWYEDNRVKQELFHKKMM